MIDKFFFVFFWSFVYHMSLLAAVAVYGKALPSALSGFCCHLAQII
jgi:hypothetical protein